MLPVGCDLSRYDKYAERREAGTPPLILWNQRWEYDKDPETMLRGAVRAGRRGTAFRVALAGENFRVQPAEFERGARTAGRPAGPLRVCRDGGRLRGLLWRADIVLSTAIHEFFGVSVVEAIYCGCLPVLPDRLSYPELLPAGAHGALSLHRLRRAAGQAASGPGRPVAPPDLREHVARFDWSVHGASIRRDAEEVDPRRKRCWRLIRATVRVCPSLAASVRPHPLPASA